MNKHINNSIACYATPPHQCSYLPDRQTTNLVVNPDTAINDTLLSRLIELGFRRSGSIIYRPNCQNCSKCISIKVQANKFIPNRSQRRNWRQNSALIHHATQPIFNDEQFNLYCKYLAGRHSGSEMSNPTPEDYIDFLTARDINTVFHEFRLEDKLLAITVTDHTVNGLSAVYTFFDPEYQHLGLGTYAILWLIQHAKDNKLPWVYLGYWINDSAKMAYKSKFVPQQGFLNNKWHEMRVKGRRKELCQSLCAED